MIGAPNKWKPAVEEKRRAKVAIDQKAVLTPFLTNIEQFWQAYSHRRQHVGRTVVVDKGEPIAYLGTGSSELSFPPLQGNLESVNKEG
jgi:hypothetical protein